MNINGAISCRWGTWNLAVTRFFLCAANRLVFSLCASAATFGFPTVLGCIRCHSFHLSIRLLSVNVVHFNCYQWCIVLRSHLIADTSTSGPINRKHSNPVNRLYSNTSFETLTRDYRSCGYRDQRDMFYMGKCTEMIVAWRHTFYDCY